MSFDEKGSFSQRFTRINPISGYTAGTTLNLAATSASDLTFEIPAQVLNFSRSYLNFSLTVPTDAASNVVHFNSLPFDRVTLQTRSGVNLVDINNFTNYSLTTALVTKTKHDYLEQDTPHLTAVRTISGVSPSSTSNPAPLAALASGAATAVTHLYQIPLRHIAHSLFAMDSSMYFAGEILTLRISFQAHRRIGYIFVAGAPPTSTVVAVVPTISTAYVYLAIETDPDVKMLTMNKFNKGVSMPVPFPYSFKFVNTGGATQYTTNIRLNAGHGRKLLRVYTTNMHESEQMGLYSQTNDIPSIIRTMLDQQTLQDFDLKTANDEDWMYMKDLVKDSALLNNFTRKSAGQWSFLDQWVTAKPHERLDHLNDGLDLTQERQYSCQLTPTANSIIYQFVVCQRTLRIQEGLITIQ